MSLTKNAVTIYLVAYLYNFLNALFMSKFAVSKWGYLNMYVSKSATHTDVEFAPLQIKTLKIFLLLLPIALWPFQFGLGFP
jgi:hypothetical protein